MNPTKYTEAQQEALNYHREIRLYEGWQDFPKQQTVDSLAAMGVRVVPDRIECFVNGGDYKCVFAAHLVSIKKWGAYHKKWAQYAPLVPYNSILSVNLAVDYGYTGSYNEPVCYFTGAGEHQISLKINAAGGPFYYNKLRKLEEEFQQEVNTQLQRFDWRVNTEYRRLTSDEAVAEALRAQGLWPD